MRVAVISTFLSSAFAVNVVLHHRIFHPSFPDLQYLERGSISGSPPTFQPSPSLAKDLNTFAEALSQLQDSDSSDVLYQVALGHEFETSQAFWDYSSVKACYLSLASAETVVLHVASDLKPYALDYFVSPIPKDGSCPLTKSKEVVSPSAAMKIFTTAALHLNTTILQNRAESPILPELRKPPPLTPEGEVVTPVPEKSFIQKYWMYIGAVLLVFLVTGGEDPERPRQAGGGGGGS